MFVTKATVVSVSGTTCSVSIPLLAGESKSNFQATICSDAGVTPLLKADDLVVVAFEDNNYGKPMVIGRFFNSSKVDASAEFKDLTVKGSTMLSTSTNIGDVTYDNIKGLKGYTGTLTTDLANLETKVKNSDPTNIDGLKKLVLSSDIYGDQDKLSKVKKPVPGQVFFLVGGDN